MKKLLITIIVLIILIFAYSQYKEYKRFHPEFVNYNSSKLIDVNYPNKEVLINYYQAIESLNNFVITKWSTSEIDVRSPKKDNPETKIALEEYANKKATVKFYEAILEQSKMLKEKGLDNTEIKIIEEKGTTKEALQKEQYTNTIKKMFHSNIGIAIGEKSAFVFEIQKLLVKKGYDIPVDGAYKTITSNAIQDFETKQNLFPDGKLDVITLEALLR
ncbi:MAG: peptidoglycan-binding domain-containing protein [Oceanihabitans sp.]